MFLGTTPDGDTTAFTDADVARRATYINRVTAWNAYGQSPHSNEVTIKSK